MKLNKKFISLFLITNTIFYVSTLDASNYDNDVLNIFSKILPRFIIMSTQKKKIKDNIEICILNDDVDKLTAESLQKKIKKNYPDGIQNYPIHLLNSNYKVLDTCKNSQLIFLFNSNEKDINRALLFAQENTILSMSYDEKLLESGVAISLFIGRKVLPYINMEAIKNNKIELNGMLLRVSKIYYGKEK